jgi:hypothetical protein
VAARYVAYGIGHRDDCEAEGESREQIGGIRLAALAAGDHGSAAAEKHQHEGADKFGEVFFPCFHIVIPFPQTGNYLLYFHVTPINPAVQANISLFLLRSAEILFVFLHICDKIERNKNCCNLS